MRSPQGYAGTQAVNLCCSQSSGFLLSKQEAWVTPLDTSLISIISTLIHLHFTFYYNYIQQTFPVLVPLSPPIQVAHHMQFFPQSTFSIIFHRVDFTPQCSRSSSTQVSSTFSPSSPYPLYQVVCPNDPNVPRHFFHNLFLPTLFPSLNYVLLLQLIKQIPTHPSRPNLSSLQFPPIPQSQPLSNQRHQICLDIIFQVILIL